MRSVKSKTTDGQAKTHHRKAHTIRFYFRKTRHQQIQTPGELLDQGGTQETAPAVWISDDIRKTLFMSQRTARTQQTGSRGNGRLEKGTQRGTNMLTWCSGGMTPTTNQKSERSTLGREDGWEKGSDAGWWWAGMQKDP